MFLLSVPLAIGRGMACAVVGILTAALYLPKLIGWILVSLISFFVAAPTFLRYSCCTEKQSLTEASGRLIAAMAASTFLLFFLGFYFIVPISSDSNLMGINGLFSHIPCPGYILGGLVFTNLLSFMYEIGNKIDVENAKAKIDNTDVNEKKDDGVSDFMTMFDSIRGFETITPDQASELYRRIIELLGEKKITPEESKKLWDIVHNGVRNNLT